MTAGRVEDLIEVFIIQHVSKTRKAAEVSRMLRREVTSRWGARSVREIRKRDVIELTSEIAQRGTPVAANKLLKVVKTFLNWCLGRAVIDSSPAEGVPLPGKEVARDRVLTDRELASVIIAVRRMDSAYGGIIEMLALTGQRREEHSSGGVSILRCWSVKCVRLPNSFQHEHCRHYGGCGSSTDS